jgi:hypothetical protein
LDKHWLGDLAPTLSDFKKLWLLVLQSLLARKCCDVVSIRTTCYQISTWCQVSLCGSPPQVSERHPCCHHIHGKSHLLSVRENGELLLLLSLLWGEWPKPGFQAFSKGHWHTKMISITEYWRSNSFCPKPQSPTRRLRVVNILS